MLSYPSLAAFVVAVLILQASPGPDMMLIVGRGIGQGKRIALLTAVGATILAGLIQLPLLALGIATIVQRFPIAFATLRWVGAAYLIFLGAKLLWQTQQRRITATAVEPVPGWLALKQGMINNLTNPKAMLFMLVFLPQFVVPAGWSVAGQLLVLGALQKTIGFVVLATIAWGSGAVGSWLARRPMLVAWQERFTAVVMIGLGLRLALGGDIRHIPR